MDLNKTFEHNFTVNVLCLRVGNYDSKTFDRIIEQLRKKSSKVTLLSFWQNEVKEATKTTFPNRVKWTIHSTSTMILELEWRLHIVRLYHDTVRKWLDRISSRLVNSSSLFRNSTTKIAKRIAASSSMIACSTI